MTVRATSGIGRALALELDERGNAVGVSGRRVDRLDDVLDRLAERAAAVRASGGAPAYSASRTFASLPRRVAYVTRRWLLVEALMKVLPGWLYRRLT